LEVEQDLLKIIKIKNLIKLVICNARKTFGIAIKKPVNSLRRSQFLAATKRKPLISIQRLYIYASTRPFLLLGKI